MKNKSIIKGRTKNFKKCKYCSIFNECKLLGKLINNFIIILKIQFRCQRYFYKSSKKFEFQIYPVLQSVYKNIKANVVIYLNKQKELDHFIHRITSLVFYQETSKLIKINSKQQVIKIKNINQKIHLAGLFKKQRALILISFILI
ncbi:unnamed protein product [Paramecium sonneborni]|uniref:Uncharacterized protein n=1 Tax=Paramecium sonneborni TaxID=65129 RepID=A0A8S1LTC9_9CILI|nr:unnamed protein product [Paramecium sonneborni]